MSLIRYISTALQPGGTPIRFLHWLSALIAVQTVSSLGLALWHQPTLISGWVLVFITASLIASVFVVSSLRGRLFLIKVFHVYGMGFCMVVIFLEMGPDSCMMWLLTWTLSLVIAERREYLSSGWVVTIMAYCMLLIGSRFVWNSLTIGNPWPPLLTGVAGCIINTYLLKIDVAGLDNYYRDIRSLLSQLDRLSARITAILAEQGDLNHQLSRVSEECIPLLGLEDCVIYLHDTESGMLVQAAAFGEKRGAEGRILNPIRITPGQGIVGLCFEKGEEMDIPDVSLFPAYIVDDQPRNSELAVPIFSNGKPVGVLDSEHSKRGFYQERHKQAFRIIAAFCGIKITEHLAHKTMEAAELAKMEADRYREMDELKNRFITNISHDLKTPLSLIKTPARQLATESTDPKTRSLAGYILKNAEHLLKVMNQLLQLNRLDNGMNQLYIVEANVAQMTADISAQYEGMVADKKIDYTISAEPIIVLTDAFRLEQIIHNLLQNAFRYTPSGGSVYLDCRGDAGQLIVEVGDSGPGIPEAMREKVFERFVKLDVNNHEGTGVGLSLVKEYALALGGTVHLFDNPGGGSRFVVRLPISGEMAMRDKVSENSNEDVRDAMLSDKPIMLIAEDHPDLNNFISHCFEEQFRCIQAFDGTDALKRIRETAPDIIITDLMMPDTDGATLIASLREDEQTAHIPVIVLTAVERLQSKLDLYALGIENYLTKPFETEELRAVVDSVLKQRKRLREMFGQRYLDPIGLNKSSAAKEDTPGEASVWVKEAVQWVLEHLEDESLSVNDLSAALSMGRNRLQREIKMATGLTPVEFIRTVRLNEARKMLATGNCHVSEAAYACGFNNLSYFSRSFKSEFGYLPSEMQEHLD